MENYFSKFYRTLGLGDDASEREVKAAYRRLAKRFHPDKNPGKYASEQFIAINEAYQILMNKELHAWDWYNTQVKHRARQRREYEEKLRKQQEVARENAQRYANMKYDAFVNSRVYRTAMVLNRVYDYIFILMGVLMIVLPFLTSSEPQRDQFGVVVNTFPYGPVIVGVLFLTAIWYFLFKLRED